MKNQGTSTETKQAKFPSARYFQIHFQHIESQLELTNRSLDALQQQVAELQLHLARAATERKHPNTEQ